MPVEMEHIENGEKRRYDMKPNFKYEAFKKLENYDLFRKVHPAGETIEWETGEDVCPERLYFDRFPDMSSGVCGYVAFECGAWYYGKGIAADEYVCGRTPA